MRLSGGEKGGMVVAGTWSPSEGLTVSDPAAYKRDPPPNVTLTVVTVEVSREIDNKNSISFHCNHLHYRTQNEDADLLCKPDEIIQELFQAFQYHCSLVCSLS